MSLLKRVVARAPLPASLRGRVLVLFGVVALGPFAALGVFDYRRSLRGVDRVVAHQTAMAAVRAAASVAEQYTIVESDAALLGRNTETTRLLQATATDDARRVDLARPQADSFAQTVWEQVRDAYYSIELRGGRGQILQRLGTPSTALSNRTTDASFLSVVEPILGDDRRGIGSVVLDVRPEALLPRDLGGTTFGRSGYLLIVNRDANSVIYDSRGAGIGGGVAVARLLANDHRTSGDSLVPHLVRYAERDSERLATFVDLPRLPWTIVSSASLAEFRDGVASDRAFDLLFVLAIAASAGLAFTILLRRTTRSLDELALAAGAVGRGHLDPTLPTNAVTEVSVVVTAFQGMTTRIQTMVREIEVSRQLAVIGEFSAQVAHEIRNPLTSLKLNLQSLSRDVRRGRLPDVAAAPLDLCVREANRLDGVVRGVLELARHRVPESTPLELHTVLESALDTLAVQLQARQIIVEQRFAATDDCISGDENQLIGMILNLVLNSVEAQPNGGKVLVATSAGDEEKTIAVLVADDGSGVSPAIADRLFHPFVSSKPGGTGLGLAVAMNTARDHGGHLELASSVDGFSGAAFRVVLPTAGRRSAR